MKLREAVTEAAKGRPHNLKREIDLLINKKGYTVDDIFLLGFQAGIPENMIAVTLFQLFGSDLVIFN